MSDGRWDGVDDDRVEHDDEASLVRPYIITGGKTQASASDLPIESVVATAEGAPTYLLGFERREITQLCTDPTSIAEVASMLDLPLGVARFLVTDLAQQGFLDTQTTAATAEVELLEQLIEGIRAL
ncbi:MAG: DUF742 domain-containing protein [Acidimicrobiia bacterium]|nr:DUF742 domain-containing protein [Acidimicrobiia bacterium]